MNKHILISGGTGLIGQKLTEKLIAKGYQVAYLTRNKNGIDSLDFKTHLPLTEVVKGEEEELRKRALGKRLAVPITVTNVDKFLDARTGAHLQTENHEISLSKGHLITEYDIESILESNISQIEIQKINAYIKLYEWDLRNNFIEEEAISNAECIIHLAGAGVADQSWTAARKKEILESRTLSTRLLINKIESVPNHVQAFINASAIGYYGLDTGGTWQYENMESKGNDFLANVVKAWENEIFKSKKIRTVAIRIGVVLSEKGGALEKMAQPVRLYVGAALGSGLQYVSWIHIDDLCEMFVKAVADGNMAGIYNGVAPQPVTNEILTKNIGKVLDKPILPINVPAFALRVMLGEMADIVLGGNRVAAEKIEKVGFQFRFREIRPAIEDLLSKS
jgi:uncharacterized protein